MTPAEKLQRIYDRLPKIECKQKCQDACSFIITTKREQKEISKELNYNPFTKVNYNHYALFDIEKDSSCKMLNKDKSDPNCGNCSIYYMRPLICRLFGLVKKMRCPFGCVPERWITDNEAKKMFKEIKAIK